MKSIILKNLKGSVIGLGVLSFLFLTTSFKTLKKKDCDTEALLSEGITKLKNFSFVKEYPFSFREKKKSGQIEFKKQMVTLNRGVRYKFLAVSNANFEGKAIVTIYNNEKQEFLLASTYNQNVKKFYDEINFECKTTGNYCLSFSFHEGLAGCAVGIMSFQE